MRKIEENSEYIEWLLKGQLDKLGLDIKWLKSGFRPCIFSNYFLPVAISNPSRKYKARQWNRQVVSNLLRS